MPGWRQGHPLIGPHGELQDFIPRPGDPPLVALSSNAQRWGKRVRLAIAGTAPIHHATVIETGDLGRTYPIQIRFRFAPQDPVNLDAQPLTYSLLSPALLAGNLKITVRRGTDPLAPLAVDVFNVGLTGAGDTVPFDVVLARQLGVDLDISGAGLWVEAVASIVDYEAPRDQLVSWNHTINPAGSLFVPAIASPGNALLLNAREARRQFIITNTSTNADLILNFGLAATWGPPPLGSVIVPARTVGTAASRYESPIGGWAGQVSGSWDNGAPNGGALVTEGTPTP